MSKLFILGNGFDLAHKLPTEYWHFRKFLESKVGTQNKDNSDAKNIDYTELFARENDGVSKYILNQEKIIESLIFLTDQSCKGDDWEDFEEATGNFYYEEFFDYCEENKDYIDIYSSSEVYVEDEFDDDGVLEDEFNRNFYVQEVKIADQLNGFIPELKHLFSEWFNTIDTAKTKPLKFNYLFHDNDLFLTFNYTKTLEEVYNIRKDNICHIHGQQGVEIVFGHGQAENPYEVIPKEQRVYSSQIYGTFSDLFNDFKKNTQKCYKRQECFFKKLYEEKIDSIISFGFSFSEVDRYYIKKICEEIDTSNIVWHLTQHDEKDGKKDIFEKIIRDCGFKGVFGKLIPNLEEGDDIATQRKVS